MWKLAEPPGREWRLVVKMMRYAAVGTALLLAWIPLVAQVTLEPRFEVVSVRPNKDAFASGGIRLSPNRLTAIANTLDELVLYAYSPLESTRLIGPDWIRRERFDIVATAPEGRRFEEFQAMVRNLLVDRFKLRAHRESRRAQVYVLSLARPDGRLGPGLRRSTVDCLKRDPPCYQRNQPRGTYHAIGSEWPSHLLMGELRVAVGTTVVDRTGLTGPVDIDLEWSDPTASAADQAADVARPALVTAMREQLGIRLEPSMEPVDFLVIDSIERPTPD
jgi:uncharacterized protein (TIGR03435 family)